MFLQAAGNDLPFSPTHDISQLHVRQNRHVNSIFYLNSDFVLMITSINISFPVLVSYFVVTHISIPYITVGAATVLESFGIVVPLRVLFYKVL